MHFKNIVFFNHWHYGDLFSTRGLVTDIMSQVPLANYLYVHSKNARSTRDLALSPDAATVKQILEQIPMHHRFVSNLDTLFINTWVGAYQGLWPNTHPSYIDHRKIYSVLYDNLYNNHKMDLKLGNAWHYVPDYDLSKYDTHSIWDFVNNLSGRVMLFCNGAVQSTQSSMGNMQNIINDLASRYPQDNFIITEPFDTPHKNIYTTNDIFQLECDICEIGILSHKCDVIVGKNSGPFTYSTTHNNLNSGKKFVCFSHKPEDVLPYGLDFTSEFNFSNTVDNKKAADIIAECVDRINIKPGFNIL